MTTASPSLPELQRWMRWVITDPRGPYRALAEPHTLAVRSDGTLAQLENWEDSPRVIEPLPRYLDQIASTEAVAREGRLSVYSDAYFIRLLGCLESDFAAVLLATGPAAFRQLAADYLLRHPSSSPHVGDLGQAFAAFVRTHELSKNLPYLPDLAALEWNVLRSIYSERLPALDVQTLAAIPESAWAGARLIVDPTVRLLGTAWAVDRLWEDKFDANAKPHKPRRQRRWLVIFRNEEWAQVRSIDGPQWFALERLQEGKTLGQVCQDLTDVFKEQSGDLPAMQWFGEWVRDGLVKKVEI